MEIKPVKKNRIRFGAFTPHIYEMLDEQQVIDLAEAGIDFPIVGFDSFTSFSKEERVALFDLYAKHGLEVIFYDPDIMSPMEVLGKSAAWLFDKDKADHADYYKDHPAFAGNSFVDEPGILHFEKLGQTVEEYKKRFPGKVPYINLLPMYANNAQLTGGAWMDEISYYDTSKNDFREYLDKYVEYVDTDYICVDIYPCHIRDGRKKTYKDYVKAIELSADACRHTGREFWVCVQSCSWNEHVRIPDEPDFRWQVYTMLSFGATALFYYVFADRPNHTGTPLGPNGEKTELWYISKRISSEIKKISDVYMQYGHVGAFNVNCTENTPYLAMYSPLASFAPILDIQCDQPLLVGCFEKKDSQGHAFTLVNMTDPAAPAALQARLKLSGQVTAYYAGQPLVLVPDSEGYYSFPLIAGDGVFVTVE